jgi:hypothetical protein
MTTTTAPQAFTSEADAINHLTARFTDDGPAEIATYVQVLKADMVDNDENPADWWKGIDGDELAETLFRLIK